MTIQKQNNFRKNDFIQTIISQEEYLKRYFKNEETFYSLIDRIAEITLNTVTNHENSLHEKIINYKLSMQVRNKRNDALKFMLLHKGPFL